MITQLATSSDARQIAPLPLPLPRVNVTVRPGVAGDVPFLDALQRLHTRQVGWMPTAQFEGKIKLGHVLIAEDASGERVGYCIGNDRYFKRDDVGIVYQMNVAPGRQRGFVGATLLQAMFDQSAYGCKLFCCWCAQDLAANRFWEAMGFVPLAFRAGSAAKSRVHLFWQKRIREGDATTPWWFPSQTGGGSLREDRIVLPMGSGTHWGDAKPLVLPGESPVVSDVLSLAEKRPRSAKKLKAVEAPAPVRRNGLSFDIPQPGEQAAKTPAKESKSKRVKAKNDPRWVAMARELRDRYLEQIDRGAVRLEARGKYDVTRQIGTDVTVERVDPKRLPARQVPLLPAA